MAMEAYTLAPVFAHDQRALREYDALCEASGIRRDAGLEEILSLRNAEAELVAAGGICGKSLRSLVCREDLRGEGLMNQLVSALISRLAERGIFHVFLWGKAEYLELYRNLGFFLIESASDRMLFMENKADAFERYLARQEEEAEICALQWTQAGLKQEGLRQAALVMNLNPISRGHLQLIEETAGRFDLTHLFLLSEDRSFFSTRERKDMLLAAVRDIPRLCLHETGDYLISSSTFPSYFLKSKDEATVLQAELDAKIFIRLARRLNLTSRVLGSEPFSELTRQYNAQLQRLLPPAGINCEIVPRSVDEEGRPISAGRIRAALKAGDFKLAQKLAPASSRPWLTPEYLAERLAHVAGEGEAQARNG